MPKNTLLLWKTSKDWFW